MFRRHTRHHDQKLASYLLSLGPVFASEILLLRLHVGIRDMYIIVFVFLYNKSYMTIYIKLTRPCWVCGVPQSFHTVVILYATIHELHTHQET
jgi:hypothetical protein